MVRNRSLNEGEIPQLRASTIDEHSERQLKGDSKLGVGQGGGLGNSTSGAEDPGG